MGFIVDRYSVSVAVPLHIIVPRLYEEKRRDTISAFRDAWCVARGAWFRIFSRYLVSLTIPTVFVRSF